MPEHRMHTNTPLDTFAINLDCLDMTATGHLQVPTGPPGVILFAVRTVLVVVLLHEQTQRLGVTLGRGFVYDPHAKAISGPIRGRSRVGTQLTLPRRHGKLLSTIG